MSPFAFNLVPAWFVFLGDLLWFSAFTYYVKAVAALPYWGLPALYERRDETYE